MIVDLISWDGNTFAPDYEAGFLPGSEPRLPRTSASIMKRSGAWPVITGVQRDEHKLKLVVRIVGAVADRDFLRGQLFGWFDPDDETPKRLVGENQDGIPMYVMALCDDLMVIGDQQHDTGFLITLTVDDDVRWRAQTAETDIWAITASGQTRAIVNGGEDEAYPVITVEPTGAKTGGYAYKRYALVVWNAINSGANYPIRLGPLDTAALVGAAKMQADGDDLRMFVDGVERARFLVDMNDANTYIWFAADWQRAPVLELAASIAGAGSVDTIQLNDADEMALLPSAGFVRVNNEVFSYQARDLVNLRLTGIAREVWGTAAGAHSAGDDVYWMQHEVIVVYGDAAATAPDAAPALEPVFTLADSSNTSWKFEIFGDGDYPTRPASWTRWGTIGLSGNGGTYTATERTLASPYTVAGAWLGTGSGNAFGWGLSNPCGIVNAAWADGKKRAVVVTDFLVHLMYWVRGASWWTWQATLADPALANTWEAWSEAAAVADWDAADTLAFAAYFFRQDVEAGTVTVSLDATETPTTSIGSEIGNYTLSCTITNETTDEAITVSFDMPLNEELVVDTDERTVTYEPDGSSQFQAVSLDSARRKWLRLVPGSNTLRFDDTGTAAVTLTTEFEERYY